MVQGGIVVSVLDSQSRGTGFKSWSGQKFGSRFLLHLMRSTLTALSYSSEYSAQQMNADIVYKETDNTVLNVNSLY